MHAIIHAYNYTQEMIKKQNDKVNKFINFCNTKFRMIFPIRVFLMYYLNRIEIS